MNTFPSSRGQKREEVASRPEGRNTIVTIWVSAGHTQTDWGPDYASAANALNVDAALRRTIEMGRTPLLWTYAEPDANYTELKFGFDEHVGPHQKIGHVALAAEATISGEIFLDHGVWRINNDSGAWGNMGGQAGKSQKLIQVARFMSLHCNMQVQASRAYSRYGIKRKIQQLFR